MPQEHIQPPKSKSLPRMQALIKRYRDGPGRGGGRAGPIDRLGVTDASAALRDGRRAKHLDLTVIQQVKGSLTTYCFEFALFLL